jgi:hypothetical protein
MREIKSEFYGRDHVRNVDVDNIQVALTFGCGLGTLAQELVCWRDLLDAISCPMHAMNAYGGVKV